MKAVLTCATVNQQKRASARRKEKEFAQKPTGHGGPLAEEGQARVAVVEEEGVGALGQAGAAAEGGGLEQEPGPPGALGGRRRQRPVVRVEPGARVLGVGVGVGGGGGVVLEVAEAGPEGAAEAGEGAGLH